MRSRGIVFACILVGCLLLGGIWVVVASQSGGSTTADARVRVAAQPDADAGTNKPVELDGRVMVRAVDPDNPRLNGQTETVVLGGAGPPTKVGRLACERVYASEGRGICLAVAPSGVDYRGYVFDQGGRVRREFALVGLPSRARVSRSGRLGAMTTFVTGDSYAAPGQFSTRTWILDLTTGDRIADLEEFQVEREGETIDSPDFNFWGVTFAPGDDRFYATLATGGKRYLVEGSIRERRMRVLRENVECPSLSPDATRIAYKKRVGGVEDWRLHVIDLETGADIALAEKRSIDDQAEWLDDQTIIYGDGKSVWAVRADGYGRPRLVLRNADSPAAL